MEASIASTTLTADCESKALAAAVAVAEAVAVESVVGKVNTRSPSTTSAASSDDDRREGRPEGPGGSPADAGDCAGDRDRDRDGSKCDELELELSLGLPFIVRDSKRGGCARISAMPRALHTAGMTQRVLPAPAPTPAPAPAPAPPAPAPAPAPASAPAPTPAPTPAPESSNTSRKNRLAKRHRLPPAGADRLLLSLSPPEPGCGAPERAGRGVAEWSWRIADRMRVRADW